MVSRWWRGGSQVSRWHQAVGQVFFWWFQGGSKLAFQWRGRNQSQGSSSSVVCFLEVAHHLIPRKNYGDQCSPVMGDNLVPYLGYGDLDELVPG